MRRLSWNGGLLIPIPPSILRQISAEKVIYRIHPLQPSGMPQDGRFWTCQIFRAIGKKERSSIISPSRFFPCCCFCDLSSRFCSHRRSTQLRPFFTFQGMTLNFYSFLSDSLDSLRLRLPFHPWARSDQAFPTNCPICSIMSGLAINIRISSSSIR